MTNYKAHLFICTKCRFIKEDGQLCDEKLASDFRKSVKDLAKAKFGKGVVRVNASGCLDNCENGICSVLYPSGKWNIQLRPGDEEKLIQAIENTLEK